LHRARYTVYADRWRDGYDEAVGCVVEVGGGVPFCIGDREDVADVVVDAGDDGVCPYPAIATVLYGGCNGLDNAIAEVIDVGGNIPIGVFDPLSPFPYGISEVNFPSKKSPQGYMSGESVSGKRNSLITS